MNLKYDKSSMTSTSSNRKVM